MRLNNKNLSKKYNRLGRIIRVDKFFNKDKYYFDNGQTTSIADINKENVSYTIIKLNTDIDTEDYLVFSIIKTNNRAVTHQLLKIFNNERDAEKYYKELKSYIRSHSNEEIINKCYEDLSDFPRKNILIRLYSI